MMLLRYFSLVVLISAAGAYGASALNVGPTILVEGDCPEGMAVEGTFNIKNYLTDNLGHSVVCKIKPKKQYFTQDAAFIAELQKGSVFWFHGHGAAGEFKGIWLDQLVKPRDFPAKMMYLLVFINACRSADGTVESQALIAKFNAMCYIGWQTVTDAGYGQARSEQLAKLLNGGSSLKDAAESVTNMSMKPRGELAEEATMSVTYRNQAAASRIVIDWNLKE